jgi:CRP-like cAMP-binding protein
MQDSHQKDGPLQNHLLASLPKNEYAHLKASLKLVELKPGDILVRPDTISQYVYFPVRGAVSLHYKLDHDMSADIALVGREGMFSIVPILGGGVIPCFAEVETAGAAYRLPARALSNEIEESKSVRRVMLLFVQALFVQIAQIYVCARYRTLRELLCLHLVLLHDRMDGDAFAMTQQMFAHMIGVRRESVSQISGELRRLRLIEYKRGQITILDRAGLEAECRGCYDMLRPRFSKLLKVM